MRSNLAILAVGGTYARSWYREGTGARPGPQGGTRAVPVPPVSQYVRPAPTHPLQPSLRASGARFAGGGFPPRAAWLGTGIAPVLPTRYTHPVSHPRYTQQPTDHNMHGWTTATGPREHAHMAVLRPLQENLGVWNTEVFY